MREQIISFETAKLAKEKGFDWKCYWYYSYKRKFPTNRKTFYPEHGTYENFNSKNTNFYEIFSAPTQCLLQKWLRENFNIIVRVIVTIVEVQSHRDDLIYNIEVLKYNDKEKYLDILYQDFKFPTWEKAFEKGLQEALKPIKLNKHDI